MPAKSASITSEASSMEFHKALVPTPI